MSAGYLADPDLLERLERWLAELRERKLRPEAALAGVDQTIAEFRKERLGAPGHPLLVIMLCGPTTAGKSSLINALAGQAISLPGLGATTSGPVIYMHADDDPDRLFEYGKAISELGQNAIARHNRAELLHKVLIDTPDIDSVMIAHRETTAALVHAADLVLFVTSSERYKDMTSAQWVSEQSSRRAMAFVLNKWDRDAIGLQWDKRHLITSDFRRVLEASGFGAAKVFNISSLTGGTAEASTPAGENQLNDLREWLTRGLNSSTSAAIQNRRRVMGWGRLSAAMAMAPEIPDPDGDGQQLQAAVGALQDLPRRLQPLTAMAAAELAADADDRARWPAMPGLFGAYARLLNWRGNREGGRPLQLPDLREAADDRGTLPAFARVLTQPLVEAARKLRYGFAGTLPFEAVQAQWDSALSELPARLALLPSATWSGLVANATSNGLRQWTGTAILLGIEAAIAFTLATVLWRVASGFVTERYASAELLFNGAALIVVLILCGHIAANLLFPSLRRRFQSELGQSLDGFVSETCAAMGRALTDHVAAIARLAAEGRAIQGALDQTIQGLKSAGQTDMVDDLFKKPEPGSASDRAEDRAAPGEAVVRRRARFE